MTPEGKVKKEIRAFLDSLGADCWYYTPVPMGYGKRGVPDFLVCYKGYFLAPEAKRRSGGSSGPLQDLQQENIRKAGGTTGYVTSVEQVKTWVRLIDEILEAA